MSVIARTELGLLRGAEHQGVVQFRGVPYARPPQGELRFRPPRPIRPWEGEFDATEHGPIAPQGPSRLRGAVGDFVAPQSEDCLTLTITTPAPDSARRPVVVWLHGGGYGTGAGSLDAYDAAELVTEGDVVVVGVNYRLGPLGYLYYEGLANGRMGLDDMIAAIRWVAEHIAAFGGDPDRITVLGQSAGAHSTLMLLTMPDVRRLFRRVVMQSAPAGIAPLSRAVAADRARQYLAVLGFDGLPHDEVVRRLLAADPEDLLRAGGTLARATTKLGQVDPPIFPVVDDIADAAGFLAAAAQGAADDGIAVIIGTNRDEALAVVVPDPRARAATREQVDAYLSTTFDADTAVPYRDRLATGRPVDVLAAGMTDFVFAGPSLAFAALASEAGANVWTYRLDWAPAGSPLGACHCIELPLVFDNEKAWAAAPMLYGTTPEDPGRDQVARRVRANWLYFARHGSPAPESGWAGHEHQIMVFDAPERTV